MNILLHMIYEDESPNIFIVDTNKIGDQDILDVLNNPTDEGPMGFSLSGDPAWDLTEYLQDETLDCFVDAPCNIDKIITVWDC